MRQAVGYQQKPKERALREPYLAAARSQLDEAAWEAAFAEGKTLTLEEAVEYARSEEEPATFSSLAPEQPLAGARPPTLTRREKEVAALVAPGYTKAR